LLFLTRQGRKRERMTHLLLFNEMSLSLFWK